MKHTLAFLIALLLGSSAASHGTELKAPKPNFLLIMADDLDTHELSCYGGKNLVTPNIDRLAGEGIRFTHMFSPEAMCIPTRTAIYTGLHPMRSGAVRNHVQTQKHVKSVAHYLAGLGYRVGIAGKVHVMPAGVYPFEYVEGFPKGSPRKAEDWSYDTHGVHSFIQRDRDQPFCLIICSTLPHAPYVVGDAAKFDANKLILQEHWADTPQTRKEFSHCLAQIDALDQQVGDVLKILEENRLVDKTLTMFSGEHGSAFPGAKWTCYNAGVRSAFIARLPGKIKPAIETDAIAMCEDVLPTLIELAGGTVADKNLDGRSLVDVLTGAKQTHRDCAFGMCNMTADGKPFASRSIMNHQYKLVLNLTPDNEYTSPTVNPNSHLWRTWLTTSKTDDRAKGMVDRIVHRPAMQIFDLQKDSWELENIADRPDLQAVGKELERQLLEWMKQQGDPGAALENMTREDMYRLWPGMRAKDAAEAERAQK
jgi:N-sulfoglucosamine sulfohydrolase